MANRNYFVKKDGEIIKELKSLSAAKKIAESEGADVYCGDELVYSAHGTDKEVVNDTDTEESVSVEKEVNNNTESVSLDDTEKTINKSTEKESDHSADPVSPAEEVSAVKYRLKALMNVRVSPSLSARKIATLQPGMIVTVAKIKDNWLHLTNGSFIFYANGKYAERVE